MLRRGVRGKIIGPMLRGTMRPPRNRPRVWGASDTLAVFHRVAGSKVTNYGVYMASILGIVTMGLGCTLDFGT